VRALVTRAMENAFDGLVKMDIPLRVNVEVGPTWADL